MFNKTKLLIEDNVTLENLDPNIYIPILDELPLGMKKSFKKYPLEMQAHNYPIRRYFARTFDLSIYSLLLTLIQNYIFQWYPKNTFFNNLLSTYLYIGLMLIIEPILISFIGTTPGKWLLGLNVRDSSDKKLSLSDSYKRTLSVFSQGLGYNIPIYNLYKYYRCYKDCKNGYVMTWDENTNYILKDKKSIRIFTLIASNIILILIIIFMSLQLYIPSNHGNLTPIKYINNCNQIIKRFHIDLNYTLDNNGNWIEKDLNESTIVIFPITIPDYNLILTDGYVTGVRLDVAINNNDMFGGIVTFKQIAFLGFYGAQDYSNTIDLHTSGILTKIKDDYSNYSYQIGNVRITNSVTMEGYSKSNGYLYSNTNEDSKLTMSFLIERVD